MATPAVAAWSKPHKFGRLGIKGAAEVAAAKAAAAKDQASTTEMSFGMVEKALLAAAHVAAIYVLYRYWRSFRFIEKQQMNDEDWWKTALGIASPVISMLGSLIKSGGNVAKAFAEAFGALHQAVMATVLAALAPFITRRQLPSGEIENTIEAHNAVILALLTYGAGVMALRSGLVTGAVHGGLVMIGEAIPL